ncbi:DUF1289 domain-containing protein [Sneathiella marina]|uniref:DUF1289 domain-containing protein n=1 Tax=Sneathiella marina TaxID=2950108 RepID=UPI003B848B21
MRRQNPQIRKIPDLPSPCTGVCTMDMDNKYCKGCFRTRLEIGGWATLSNEEKLDIVKNLRIRRAQSKT